MGNKKVLFGDYSGYALTDKDYEVYLDRLSSQVIIIKNKIYDQKTKTFTNAENFYIVADYQDGEYVSFKIKS